MRRNSVSQYLYSLPHKLSYIFLSLNIGEKYINIKNNYLKISIKIVRTYNYILPVAIILAC
jgi:hypothetical protein